MSRVLRYTCLLWCAGLWVLHVYELNKEYNFSDTYYGIGDSFDFSGLKVTVEECHVFTQNEYMNYFNIDECDAFEEYDGDIKVLCLKLSVINNTNERIHWQSIFDSFGYGFESEIWCSSCNPLLESVMNIYESEYIDCSDTGEFWRATIVSEDYFKTSYWENIDNIEFYYLINIQPNRIRIRLK